MNEMTKMLDSMENSIKLQQQARAKRRADKAEQKEKDFLEKLMRAETGKAELDAKATKLKGAQDAVQRDQLIAFMMAGF